LFLSGVVTVVLILGVVVIFRDNNSTAAFAFVAIIVSRSTTIGCGDAPLGLDIGVISGSGNFHGSVPSKAEVCSSFGKSTPSIHFSQIKLFVCQ
jgi:hypothetical protein